MTIGYTLLVGYTIIILILTELLYNANQNKTNLFITVIYIINVFKLVSHELIILIMKQWNFRD
jgi:hypothetical protein